MADSKGNILKVRLGNDTRRQVLFNTSLSYNDLTLMLQRIFAGKLQPSDDVTLKYYDEDGDLITIVDDADFAHAREYSQTGVVNMVIYVNGKDTRTCIDGANAASIRKELGVVRDKVNSLIDSLTNQSGGILQQQSSSSSDNVATVLPQVESTVASTEIEKKKSVSSETLSVFDPYKSSQPTNTMQQESSTANPGNTTQPSAVSDTVPVVPPHSSSSVTTTHLFQSTAQGGESEFLSHVSAPVPAQQTGQIGTPQTGQQQSNPSAPPIVPPSSSPKPPQQTGYTGYPPQSTTNAQFPVGGGASYATTGQGAFPTSQPYRPSSRGQPGYPQPGMSDTSGYTNPGAGGYNTGGTSFPPNQQSSAPTPPSTAQAYPPPPSTNQGGYPPGFNQPHPPQGGTYGNQPGGGTFPVGGAGRGGGRMTAYGQSYKVGYN